MRIFALFAILFCIYISSVSADNCAACKSIAQIVKTSLQNNQTQAQIEQEVLAVCGLLPSPYNTQCKTIVQTYFPQIVQLVITYDNPDLVCELIGFCKALDQVGNFDKCSVCHFLVGVAEAYIERNSTEQEILKVFESACAIIPGAARAVCDKVIEQFGPQLIAALLNRENPDTVCKQIRLCTASLMEKVAPAPVFSHAEINVKGATECYVCKLVVGYLENFVKSNSTEQEIIKAAEKVCGILPKSLAGVCDTFVDNYVPQIINLLLNKVPPASICAYIKQCTSSLSDSRVQTVAQAQQLGNSQYCQVCQFVVSTAENFLSSNATEEEIIALGDKVCSVLPAKYSQLCKQFVDEGLPLAIQFILAKESPQSVCTQLKLCTSSRVDFVKVNLQH